MPKRGIGATTLTRVQEYASEKEISFYDALRQAENVPALGRSVPKLKSFVTFIQSLRTMAEEVSVRELLETILDETGYVKELEAEGTEEAEARIENIDELISKVASYEGKRRASHFERLFGGKWRWWRISILWMKIPTMWF